ncbi:M6 family metalloprotease domain-containing protein [Mangrovimicrobium sediminis]|uniref:M6 family metalloprotease domain-containing protein n=2 Tax=Mangrovimicrobium sediminis TaxID=2562682 RepID=A0A4Z0M7F6_9GAMM|nr:M6 family metalloprotease domain-containing protein [Haliea sp. SAOS-164]
MVDNLAALRFDALGHPQIQSDSIHPVSAPASRPHRLLIMPVRFSDKGYDRFAGDPEQDVKNRAWFQDLLFAGGVENASEDTLTHYYQHQSRGRYNITGDIFPVVQLEKPLHYYGRPVQSGNGEWRNDENTQDLVVDAIAAAFEAHPDFPWADYDQWDPADFDGDGNRDEPDGYIDHFVMIVAGKGQSSCQGLYKLGEKLNVQAPPDAFDKLTQAEQDCADRIWPHRSSLLFNLDDGPQLGANKNVRGGIPVGNGLWLLDYNMQSEYTDVSTFIHEFGHSLGLPDIYARLTNNSTAAWDVMSSTASPVPQEMSAWTRMVLGWLQPCVVRSPQFGGEKKGGIDLKVMNASGAGNGACDAAMVILPPKYRDIELGPLRPGNGRQAAYSGQGNDMNRSLARRFDLNGVDEETPILLSMDLWFEIETEWDYLYVEAARDGEPYRRLLPLDKDGVDDQASVMPWKKGHEGNGSLPGFSGRSGDLDGDTKVETAAGCDPTQERKLAEDNIGDTTEDPCAVAQWVTAMFDLSEFRGDAVNLRITYFTDTAAVENGALVDNILVPALGFREDFEGPSIDGWDNTGFTLSGGSHHLTVPQFYILEYRDPYADFGAGKNYDAALVRPGFTFYPDAKTGMTAISINYRPGVLAWYYNGEYLWSQNDPAEFGPGHGYLLLVDANPQEYELPLMPPRYFQREDGWSAWSFDDDAQPLLEKAFVDVMCFERRPPYYSSDVAAAARASCSEQLLDGRPPVEALRWDGRELTYGYTIINEYLPGIERESRKAAGTFYDLRIRDGVTQYRLYDRLLRAMHSADAPFALDPFERGIQFYHPRDGEMRPGEARPFAPVSRFTDARPNRYLSPKLPFGGADIPEAGFEFELAQPGEQAPAGSVVRVNYRWRE